MIVNKPKFEKWINHHSQTIRLDQYLQTYINNKWRPVTRSQIQKWIQSGDVLVNNIISRPSFRLTGGEEITICLYPQTTSTVIPQKLPLDIVYEDDDILIINKQNHVVVHPAPGHPTSTLLNGIVFYTNNLATVGSPERVGIVHRLDKDTTGLVAVAKNNHAYFKLSEQFCTKKATRIYQALCHGVIHENEGKIDMPIGRDQKNRLKMNVSLYNSKNAITNFVVKTRFKNDTYLQCRLETGRTHQIRVHLSHINHPIWGDHLYGLSDDRDLEFGQYLHAGELRLYHPVTDELLKFKAPLPEAFIEKLTELNQHDKNKLR